MKNFTFLLCVLTIAFNALAQELTITFQPIEGGNAFDSIVVVNLTTPDTVTLNSDETLILGQTTGVTTTFSGLDDGVLYPNPSNGNTTLCFSTQKEEEVILSVYNVSGTEIKKQKQTLNKGNHRFQLSFPTTGIYIVSVLKSDQNLSYKTVYTGSENNEAFIKYKGNEAKTEPRQKLQLKSAVAEKNLGFSEGDLLHYICYSDSNSTVVADSPTASKTVEVEIYACDIEGKKYRTVKIGDQVWMAENLDYLPQVNGQEDASASEEKYYVYNYDGTDVDEAKASDFYSLYGVLYNITAAMNNAPRGWHVPTNDDWNTLRDFVNTDQGTSEQAGQHLKTTVGWIEEGAGNGYDTYGFSALPNGRLQGGGYCCATGYGFYWSATEVSAEEGHKYYIVQTDELLYDSDAPKASAHAVRYIMNE